MASKTEKSGKILVQIDDDKKTHTCDPSDIELNQHEPLNAPWYYKNVLIYRSKQINTNFEELLQHTVAGLDVTFLEVFEEIKNHGHPLFIIGGSVRDFVLGKTVNEVKDFDISFGCSAKEIYDIASKNNWKCDFNTNGLCNIGVNFKN